MSEEIGWRVQLCTGVLLAGMALAAVYVDVRNNFSYGVTSSNELAFVMVLAALGVVAVPVTATILGWSRLLRALIWVCVILTVYSAINAYSAKQGLQILAAQGAQQTYEDALKDADIARAEAKKARAEADAITETASVEALTKLVNDAQKKVDELTGHAKEMAIECARYKKCQTAEADLKTVTERKGKAESKAAALKRAAAADVKVEKAKVEARGGPAEASMIATVIAGWFRADSSELARYIALILNVLSIILTQLCALLGGDAAQLIASAMKTRSALQAAKPKPAAVKKPPKPQTPPTGKGKAPKPRLGNNVVKLDAARKSVERWLDTAGKGGEMRGGDALKAYKREAGSAGANMSADKFQSLLVEILGADAVVRRASGYVIVGRSLRGAGEPRLMAGPKEVAGERS
ncbi:MAG: hypothetical protein WBX25_29355 [Rhodomicrobium sp.]